MNRLFNPESKLMQFGAKVFDLISLQIAVLLFSLPIFTAGAAFTAMHFVLLRIYRDGCTSVWKDFWTSFKENFRQATAIWLLILFLLLFLWLDYRLLILAESTWLRSFVYLLLIPILYLMLGLSWVFVLQSRYRNPIKITIKNALAMVFARPFYTIINTILMAAPFLLLLIYTQAIPILFFLGYTLPGFSRAVLYSKVFDNLEGTSRQEQ